MVPFVNTDLFTMLQILISRFIKPASLNFITSSAELLKLDLDTKESDADYKKIDIGLREVLEFRIECKQFLLTTVKNLMTKAAIFYYE